MLRCGAVQHACCRLRQLRKMLLNKAAGEGTPVVFQQSSIPFPIQVLVILLHGAAAAAACFWIGTEQKPNACRWQSYHFYHLPPQPQTAFALAHLHCEAASLLLNRCTMGPTKPRAAAVNAGSSAGWLGSSMGAKTAATTDENSHAASMAPCCFHRLCSSSLEACAAGSYA